MEKSKEEYARFVHALLLQWLDIRENQSKSEGIAKSIQVHLKELSTEEHASPTIVAYLSSQMQSLTGLLL